MRHRVRFWLTWWAGLFALYELLVFSLQTAEIVSGAICAAVSATAAELVRSRGKVRFAPGFGWIRALPGLVREVAVDTLRLVPLLWRAIRGRPVHGRVRF